MESLYCWCKINNIPHYALDCDGHVVTQLNYSRDQSQKKGRNHLPIIYQYKNLNFKNLFVQIL